MWEREDASTDGLVHHSDRPAPLDRNTERLAEAGIEPSVGSRGDSSDNALAETIIGLYKTEAIRPAAAELNRRPRRTLAWRTPEEVFDEGVASTA